MWPALKNRPPCPQSDPPDTPIPFKSLLCPLYPLINGYTAPGHPLKRVELLRAASNRLETLKLFPPGSTSITPLSWLLPPIRCAQLTRAQLPPDRSSLPVSLMHLPGRARHLYSRMLPPSRSSATPLQPHVATITTVRGIFPVACCHHHYRARRLPNGMLASSLSFAGPSQSCAASSQPHVGIFTIVRGNFPVVRGIFPVVRGVERKHADLYDFLGLTRIFIFGNIFFSLRLALLF